MTKQFEYTGQDYFYGNGGIPGAEGSDTITFNTHEKDDCITFGAAESVVNDWHLNTAGQDYISFDLPKSPDLPTTNGRKKYSEDKIIKELQEYIGRTYDQHYSAGSDKIQTLDLIEACGDGEAFCRSNILKYASRYDKKGTARRDIMKILHYAVLLMHFNDKNAQRETYPQ